MVPLESGAPKCVISSKGSQPPLLNSMSRWVGDHPKSGQISNPGGCRAFVLGDWVIHVGSGEGLYFHKISQCIMGLSVALRI